LRVIQFDQKTDTTAMVLIRRGVGRRENWVAAEKINGEWKLNGRRIHDQVMQCVERDLGKLNRVKL